MADLNEKLSTPNVSGLTVLGMEKDVVQLASLWHDRRIILTFLRHFG
jgi:hypothetical protein